MNMNPNTYKAIRQASTNFNDKKDCTVVSLAAATGVTYAEAHKTMADHGRKRNRGAKPDQMLAALKALGFEFRKVEIEEIQKNYPPKYRPRTLTPSQVNMIPHAWKNGKTYICFTFNHALTVMNGEVIDWTEGRCHRITSLYEVIGDRKPEAQLELFSF